MTAESTSSRAETALLALTVLWSLVGLGFIAWQFARGPMHARAASLDARLGAIVFHEESFETPQQVNYRTLRENVVRKQALWKDLVAPPPKPVAPEKAPDLESKLNGVRASAREAITVGGAVTIKVRTEGDPNGRWLTVGDTVNGLTIADITPEKVIFSAEIKNKTYTVELKRN